MFVLGAVWSLASMVGLAGSVGADTPRASSIVTLFGSAAPPIRAVSAHRAAELGVVFRASRPGKVVGIRFYKGKGNTGRHTGTLWSATGVRLASVTFRHETASGWQRARFRRPVAIAAGETYVASYHAPRGRYAERAAAFRTRKVRGPLTAVGSRRGYGPRVRFPAGSGGRANYYVDVQFVRTRGASAQFPPLGSPSCVPGATDVTTAGDVRRTLQGGHNACVTADVGDVDLDGVTGPAMRYLGTAAGGAMGHVSLDGASHITLRARMRSVEIRSGASFITVEQSVIGGTPAARVYDQLIFMPDHTSDVTIQDNDIGWTLADNSGNTGYGCRCYGDNDHLLFRRNRVHDIAADGFQGAGGDDVVIDRNEIGPVGANPGSDEHSDLIQITGNDNNLQITNNWLHDQGYFDGQAVPNAGATYIHGGSTGALLYENNLVIHSRGRVEVGGLGTGGTDRSNLTIRRNTFADLGLAFAHFPGFKWDLTGGTGNTVEGNLAVDPDGGFSLDGARSAATFSDNLWTRSVRLDAEGNCVSAACNPRGQAPIGYRKPSGVHW